MSEADGARMERERILAFLETRRAELQALHDQDKPYNSRITEAAHLRMLEVGCIVDFIRKVGT
jgi:hypothetical protein